MRRFLLSLLLSSAVIAGGLLQVAPAHAQLDAGLGQVGQTIKLNNGDPRVIASRIINVALGLIGIVLVVIILYAGFLYMTSGGDSKKTSTALKYIRNAIIGLIIILMSWAIARFVIERLLAATGQGGGVGGGGGSGGGGGLPGGGGGSQVFSVSSITPSGSVNTRKVIIKIVFNKPVSPASAQAAGAITVQKLDGTVAPGDVTVDGRVIRFTSTTPCPAPNQDRRCFEENTDYRVRVSANLESTTGQKITCGGFSASCEATFRTGTEVDITPPSVSITYPANGQGVPADSLVDVNAFISDQTGVSYVQVSDGTDVIGEASPTGNTPTQFDGRVEWDTAGLALGSQRTLTATGYDVDSGVGTSDPVNVVIRAPSCFNGVKDGDETQIDCGGTPDTDGFCGACSGSSCSNNNQCSSGVCANGTCVEQPIITSVTPLDGAVGSYVTLRGVNFGSNGQVTFLGSGGAGVVATAPQACTAAGAKTWSPTQVIIQVPAGAQNGALRLTNAASSLSDSTNVAPNPFINDFLVNNTLRPGICAAVPDSGSPGQSFKLLGTGFGNVASPIAFGTRNIISSSWTTSEAQALIPNVNNGAYAVSVQVSGQTSNPVDVRVTAGTQSGPPEVVSIEPNNGPIGTYVTLAGRNFGNSTGQVFFRDVATGREALADTNFPPQCTKSFWSDGSVVIKVPPSFTQGGTGALVPGAYAVRVVSARANSPSSNEVNFALNTNPATPGICAIEPSVAPVGTEVKIYGERFTSGAGQVKFYQNRNGSASPWTNAEIASIIPAGALTGPVTVTPAAGGLTSNGYLVQVRNCNESPNICSEGSECCGDGTCRAAGSCVAGVDKAMFAWRSSTGIIPRAPRVIEECRAGEIPSPSPWIGRSGGDNACVNSVMVMRFTTRLEPASVAASANTIKVFKCTGTGSDPCDTQSPVLLAPGSPRLQSANAVQDYLTVSSQNALEAGTLYEVVLTTGVKGLGAAGANMVEDATRCGDGNAYCFRFRTRLDAAACALGSVEVTPDPYTANEQGPLPVNHTAVPLAKEDACTVLECRSYSWNWSASDGRATVTNNLDLSQNPAVGACEQTATAQLETGDDPVRIQASTLGVTGSGDLYVKFVPPRVVRFGPNCDEACVNAAAWAVFNVDLDPASVNTTNVIVQRCVNESCLELDPPLALPQSAIKLVPVADSSDARLRQITIAPVAGTPAASLLLPGRFYKVTLRGGFQNGIRSTNDVPLSGLNDPEGFAWTFRVKPGDSGFCQVDRIAMAPTEKYETMVGARQGFVASPFSAADSCSEQGQQLTSIGGFSWASSRPTVATLLSGGMVDTGGVLPSGCSGRCTFLGSSGRSGQTARCGNGAVETTNAKYCINGRTPAGQNCSILPAGGQGGEECDDGNNNANDTCNNSCLWNPVISATQGGTCGNAIVNVGEDCDRGRVCTGAPADSATPNGTSCTSGPASTACAANGGTCAPSMARGCSVTCRNLGSSAGGSTCGNGDVADGEDCDDGNVASGDGCSADCLHEGSSREVYALCGNGTLEPGEACERVGNGAWPANGCDATTCLRTGVAPCTVPGQTLCCGDGVANEAGKDCDDGNTVSGDGCSALCLAEGSSIAYATPSFCSNGILERGEQCESPGPAFTGDTVNPVPGGDGEIDGVQLATIVGRDVPDAQGKMSSNITATLTDQGKNGTAIYGLQCGFTDERSCSPDRISYSSQSGLTSAGCCDARPRLESVFPPNAAGDTVAGRPSASDPFPTGVCRNVLISGNFAVEMDPESLQGGNFLVAKRLAGTSCPNGLNDVTDAFDAPKGFRGFVQRAWNWLLSLLRVPSAHAQRWCAGAVTGVLTTQTVDGKTEFFYTLDEALEARTEYRIRFMGDNSDPTNPLADNDKPENRKGVKSWNGVVTAADTGDNGPLTWHFTTGDRICTINNVNVRDLTLQHPYFYVASNERHPFVSYAQALINGIVVPLSPTSQYRWEWQNWVFSNPNVIAIDPASYPAGPAPSLGVTTKEIVSKNVSGDGFLSARVKITSDTVNTPSTQDQVIQGTAHLTVNLCENPWPSLATAPFRDEKGSPDLRDTVFEAGPFYNFAMTYCRDAGVAGPNGDLPGLTVNAAPVNGVDAAQGVLRQYLFTFRQEDLQQDGIGIRIAANPLHLSPMEWYRSKGFTGNPKELTVDGYPAVQDGRTVYISGVNTNGPDASGNSTDLYTNIYLISYNDGAKPITRQIFDALLASMSFNTNVQFDVANACQTLAGSLDVGADGLPITCAADWECDELGDGHRCASFKGKLQRDLVRLGDFQTMARDIESSKAANGKYPTLATGSYLAGITTSRWPSWDDAFKTALGGKELPEDPVNRFVTCGRCSQGGTACVADTDCKNGDTCVSQQGFDPGTCWNNQSNQFMCPVPAAGQNTGSQTRVYQYRAIAGGARFEIGAEFEVQPPNPLNLTQNWWKPAVFQQLKQCYTTTLTNGNLCSTDADCRVCPSGNCTGIATPAGACQVAGGQFRYNDLCQGGATFGSSGTCGDGVIDTTSLACLGGSRDGQLCTVNSDCPGGSCAAKEMCELTGPTATRQTSCTTNGNAAGWKQQRCLDCRSYVDDSSAAGCFAVSQCGNGRVDGVCANNATKACTTTADCGGAACRFETCDDGSQNGTYGKCNLTCTGIGGYCGDSTISPGEVCDAGATNGAYCSAGSACSATGSASCNLTCTGPAPFCGNGTVDGSETCDGNTETRTSSCTPGRACASPDPAFRGISCTSNAQCGAGGTCLSATVPYVQTRTCRKTGANACRWNTWSACRPQVYCGNGAVDSGEECDDGNDLNEDGCTNVCKKNSCGDGYLYNDVEECDSGAQNGRACTSAEYGATCSSCSTSCKFQLTQGGYCGDQVKNPGSAEQCDGTNGTSICSGGSKSGQPCTSNGNCPSGTCAAVSCKSLGFDYLKPALSKIQCTSSCQFDGCAYCGETPGNGIVEGTLLDTLFQQPVPNARIALFYRGLQVTAVTTDENGYYKFDKLDTQTGCNQYNLVVDSYTDNPLTTIFDESKRGGYQPVSVGPFQPSPTSLMDAVTGAKKGIQVTYDGRTMAQINMLPRLSENEYVVQMWWDPNGGYETIQEEFAAALADGSEASYYAAMEPELHDLVIRMPFTYAPGGNGSCTPQNTPKVYNPDDADRSVNGRNDFYNCTSSGGSTFCAPKENYEWEAGTSGVDQNEALLGMLNCTNKIRATLSSTCSGGSAPDGVGCSVTAECRSSQYIDKYRFSSSSSCSGGAEESRQGSVRVLDGQMGAYLFCFHPEFPLGDSRRSDSNCGNFVLPPQSAFLTTRGGQYDVLISKYLLYQDARMSRSSIRTWLADRNAEVRIYSKDGLVKTVNYNEAASIADSGRGWNAGDQGNWCLAPPDKSTMTGAQMLSSLYEQYENLSSPIWTPVSIDSNAQAIKTWNEGYAGADYRYFADLIHRENWLYNSVGRGYCWERTCSAAKFSDGSTFPVTENGSRPSICSGTGYSGRSNVPACNTSTKNTACKGLTYTCASTVDANATCVKVCTTDADCTDAQHPGGGFCGGFAGACTTAGNPPIQR